MNVVQQSSKTINLFDRYRLILPPGLKHHQDGLPGKRVLFITDCDESFDISFEEDLECMDMIPDTGSDRSAVPHQCSKIGKYIHLKRNNGNRVVCAFFHMELADNKGRLLHLPGQMVVYVDYTWADGIEPVLMELLDGIEICE